MVVALEARATHHEWQNNFDPVYDDCPRAAATIERVDGTDSQYYPTYLSAFANIQWQHGNRATALKQHQQAIATPRPAGWGETAMFSSLKRRRRKTAGSSPISNCAHDHRVARV